MKRVGKILTLDGAHAKPQIESVWKKPGLEFICKNQLSYTYIIRFLLVGSNEWAIKWVPQYAPLWENYQIPVVYHHYLRILQVYFFLQTDYFQNRYMGFFNRNELESKVYTIMIYVYDYECKSNKNQKTICPQEILPYHQNKMYLFI